MCVLLRYRKNDSYTLYTSLGGRAAPGQVFILNLAVSSTEGKTKMQCPLSVINSPLASYFGVVEENIKSSGILVAIQCLSGKYLSSSFSVIASDSKERSNLFNIRGLLRHSAPRNDKTSSPSILFRTDTIQIELINLSMSFSRLLTTINGTTQFQGRLVGAKRPQKRVDKTGEFGYDYGQ